MKKKIIVIGVLMLLTCISVGAISNNFEETQIQTNEKEPEYEPKGYTPISIIVPREGWNINKNAPLVLVTQRLKDVCCSGPVKITVYIETCGDGAEVIAGGSVLVNLVAK